MNMEDFLKKLQPHHEESKQDKAEQIIKLRRAKREIEEKLKVSCPFKVGDFVIATGGKYNLMDKCDILYVADIFPPTFDRESHHGDHLEIVDMVVTMPTKIDPGYLNFSVNSEFFEKCELTDKEKVLWDTEI